MSSGRIAVIDIDGELLSACAGLLTDAGLQIAGSMPGIWAGMVRLIIRGDVLPAECEDGTLHVVTAHISVDAYGTQRLRRVTGFTIGPVVEVDEKAT